MTIGEALATLRLKLKIIDDGEIKGLGTNEELLANNSIYQDIYYSQLKANGGEDDE